jgi:hypothetical protein
MPPEQFLTALEVVCRKTMEKAADAKISKAKADDIRSSKREKLIDRLTDSKAQDLFDRAVDERVVRVLETINNKTIPVNKITGLRDTRKFNSSEAAVVALSGNASLSADAARKLLKSDDFKPSGLPSKGKGKYHDQPTNWESPPGQGGWQGPTRQGQGQGQRQRQGQTRRPQPERQGQGPAKRPAKGGHKGGQKGK